MGKHAAPRLVTAIALVLRFAVLALVRGDLAQRELNAVPAADVRQVVRYVAQETGIAQGVRVAVLVGVVGHPVGHAVGAWHARAIRSVVMEMHVLQNRQPAVARGSGVLQGINAVWILLGRPVAADMVTMGRAVKMIAVARKAVIVCVPIDRHPKHALRKKSLTGKFQVVKTTKTAAPTPSENAANTVKAPMSFAGNQSPPVQTVQTRCTNVS